MKVHRFEIGNTPQFEHRPFARISQGEGCPCGCSPGYWVSISDGQVGLTAQFDSELEFHNFLADNEIYINEEG